MKSIIRILAIVAVVQLVLVAVAYTGGSRLPAAQAGAVLLSFAPAEIDSIRIEGPNKQAVTLHKGDSWKTAAGFPADSGKVSQILQRLSELKHGLAVATSASSLARFKLSDDGFERHLVLSKAGKVVAELYLGKGAGARQSYARDGEHQAVYSVSLGSYELPLDESQWQNKGLLQISSDQVNELELAGIVLTRSGNGDKKSVWRASPMPAGKQLDQHAVEQALHLLATLRFDKVLGKQPPADFDVTHPILTVSVRTPDIKRQYRFAAAKQGDRYLLKVSDRDEYFAVSSFLLKQWQQQMKQDILFVDVPQPAAGQAGQGVAPAISAGTDGKESPSKP